MSSVMEAPPTYQAVSVEKVAMYSVPEITKPKVFGIKQKTLLYILLGFGISYSTFMLGWSSYDFVDSMEFSPYFPLMDPDYFYESFQLLLAFLSLVVLLFQFLFAYRLMPVCFQLGLLSLFSLLVSDGISQSYFCMEEISCPSVVILCLKSAFLAAVWKASSVIRFYKERQFEGGYTPISEV
ncbi:hypothetical protein HMI54_000582 [Coelomomyces lativittatus]|nr:hypothetical protein HMI56_000532 [Coelomomyces lativittatus]KAJ1511701.1 hypothetical protein HMI54_000582 [Coelomomyces lativittatus]